MVGARTFAMAANRIIDRHIDARNPRTAQRELVTGAVCVRTAWIGAAVALVVFLAAARAAEPAVPGCSRRSRSSRWSSTRTASASPTGRTRSSALAQAVGPIGAWLAVTGTFAGSGPAWVLGARGRAVDRRLRPHLRLPGRRGRPRRSACAACPRATACRSRCGCRRLVHVVTFALFVWFGVLVGLGWPWWVGLALTAVAFGYQHVDRAPRPTCPG